MCYECAIKWTHVWQHSLMVHMTVLLHNLKFIFNDPHSKTTSTHNISTRSDVQVVRSLVVVVAAHRKVILYISPDLYTFFVPNI